MSCERCGDTGRVRGTVASVAGRAIPLFEACDCRTDLADRERRASRILGAGLPELYRPWKWDSFDEDRQPDAVRIVRSWLASLALDDEGRPVVTTRRRRWCYLSGAPGLGKTHLSSIAAAEAARAGRDVLWRSVPDILPTGGGRDADAELGRCRVADVLVLDDLGVRDPSPWQAEATFRLLDARYRDGRPTLITSNLGIADLSAAGFDRITDRIIEQAHGAMVLLTGSSYRRTR
jgi:DNA replication protein DnaC